MDCLKNLKNVSVTEKLGDMYLLDCRTKNRDAILFFYEAGADFITKKTMNSSEKSGNALLLSDSAKEKIVSAVSQFECTVAESEDSTYTAFDISAGNNKEIRAGYKRTSATEYKYVLFSESDSGRNDIRVKESCNARILIRDMNNEAYLPGNDMTDINTCPLYKVAAEHNDRILLDEIKVYYNAATRDDCDELSRLTGKTILYNLPAEFNKDCIVDSSTVDSKLLEDSGYRILHRPYFAMKGSTHSKWTLNPHTKQGVDAAPSDEVSITFTEFSALFDNH